MKQGWNGSKSHDRFCHWCICNLWHGHGNCRIAFILDKKMNDYVIDKKAQIAFSSSKLAVDWYKKQYHRLLEENTLLNEELQALIRQNNELQRIL